MVARIAIRLSSVEHIIRARPRFLVRRVLPAFEKHHLRRTWAPSAVMALLGRAGAAGRTRPPKATRYPYSDAAAELAGLSAIGQQQGHDLGADPLWWPIAITRAGARTVEVDER